MSIPQVPFSELGLVSLVLVAVEAQAEPTVTITFYGISN